MRIGILSLPIHGNYGGVLQNFALYSVLKQHGYQVTTIDYKKAKHQRIKQAIFRLIRRGGEGLSLSNMLLVLIRSLLCCIILEILQTSILNSLQH